MSVRRLDPLQPESFSFTPENLTWVNEQIAKYPEGKQASAVVPLLWRAQKQHGGWLPEPAIRHVAKLLDMAHIRVLEIATFYTMFNLSPVGKYFVQLCGTTPCWLRGADDLKQVCRDIIGPPGQVTEDGLFSWLEVECLGACCNAPMVQINDDYYEDLNAERLQTLLMALREGKPVQPGPQMKRQFSAPFTGPTTLTNLVSRAPVAADLSARAGEVTPSQVSTQVENQDTAQTSQANLVADQNPDGVLADPGETDTITADPHEPENAPADGQDSASPSDLEEPSDSWQPEKLSAARDGVADDLKKISGVGPKLENTLHELGIFHFDQIAAWTDENIAWIDNYLSFKGRVVRENWIGQAKTLAEEARGSESASLAGDEKEEV